MEQVLFNESRIPRAHHVPQAALGGDRHRHRRTVRRRGTDHRHRRRARLAASASCSHVTADERKTLLAAGAAAGMAATFGSPVSAVLLAVELLLFEYRPRSLIPVALAARRGDRGAHRVRRLGAGLRDARPRAARRARRSPSYVVARRARRRRRRCCVTRAVYAIEDALRAAADPLDVVAGASARSPSASSATSRRTRSASATTTSSDIARRRARRPRAARPLRR